MNRLPKVLIVLLLASMALSACGGGAGDPVATVKSVVQAIQDKKFDSVADFVCAEKKAEVTRQLDFRSSLGGLGFDVQQMVDAMNFDLSNFQYTKTSESGDKAVVSVKGDMKMTMDRDKFKVVIVDLLKAQGLTDVSDDMVNTSLDMLATQFESGVPISSDVDVVKEGGAWKVCGGLSLAAP